MALTRERILDRLRAQLAMGKPIVGCGAGTAGSTAASDRRCSASADWTRPVL